MVRILVDLKKPYPSYLKNWSKHYRLFGQEWGMVIEMFRITTRGRMVGFKGYYVFDLVFEQDSDATEFMLRWS